MTSSASAATIPSEMKTIVYGTESSPRQEMRPVPKKPKSNHVLVRVHAAGLNPVDAKNVMGDKLPHSWTTLHSWYERHYLSNKIPGFDFSGTVVQAAAGFQVGDEVFGTMPPFHGTLAEYVSAPIHQVCYKPKTLSFEQAAALPLVGLTALQCLQPHATPTSSSSILILGASGGTGHVAIQVAKALGMRQITAVCSQRNSDFCKELGATHVVNYDSIDILQGLSQAPGKPYSIVLDCVTSADPRDQTMDYPKLIQDESTTLLTDDYIYRRLGGQTLDWFRAGLERTVGLNCWRNGHEKLFWIRFPHSAHELRQLQEWAENDSNRLCPHIAKEYEFTPTGVKNAFDDILSRRVKGKVVVKVMNKEDKS